MGCCIETLMVAWDEKAHRLVTTGNDTLGFREFAALASIESDRDLWRVIDAFCEARGLMFPWRFLEVVPDEDVLAQAAPEP